MVDILVFNLNLAQHIVPCLAATGFHLFKVATLQLAQVTLGLLFADERRCHLYVYLLATTGLEANDGASVVTLGLNGAFAYVAIGNGGLVGEGLVKLQYEIVFEVVGHATAIAGGITYNHVLFGKNFYV